MSHGGVPYIRDDMIGDIRIRRSVLPSVVGIPNPFFGMLSIYWYEIYYNGK